MVTPEWRIKQAFLQLEFAIKVMCHFERRDIDKASFDRDTVLRLPEGVLRYPVSSFNTYEDLILAAQNVYSTTLGFSAISLDTAFVRAGVRNDPANVSDRGNLRALVYQVRCAFAHDMMYPKWRIDERYRREMNLTLRGMSRTIDLRPLNGQPFELESIGGMPSWVAIKDEMLAWMSERSNSPTREHA
jgi:hypothetical protein